GGANESIGILWATQDAGALSSRPSYAAPMNFGCGWVGGGSGTPSAVQTTPSFGCGCVGGGSGTPSAVKTTPSFGCGCVGGGSGTPSATCVFRHSLLLASGWLTRTAMESTIRLTESVSFRIRK